MPTSATIGAAGGTLVSSDGRLTISVPAGALAADTTIGITPITATAPGALGSGYRLTPEGTTFAQPVTLTFDYPLDEAGANLAASLRIATRDARGTWSVPAATRDAAQRKVSVSAVHFSDWSFVGGLQLAPASAVVLVNRTLDLQVISCGAEPDPDAPAAAPVLRECRPAPPLSVGPFSVNGIVGGDSAVGTIAPGRPYTAPAAVPAQNPVAVSTDVFDVADPSQRRTLLVSNVKVADEIQAYAGTVFGRIAITVNGEEQFFETSANLRFVRNPELSFGGTEWYDGSGTASVYGKPFGCGAGSARAGVLGATLVLHTEGPLAGTYSISGGAGATATLTCGDPPRSLTGPFLVGSFTAGGTDICPAIEIGSDRSRLAGSWFCNVGAGSTGRVNWTLRAIE